MTTGCEPLGAPSRRGRPVPSRETRVGGRPPTRDVGPNQYPDPRATRQERVLEREPVRGNGSGEYFHSGSGLRYQFGTVGIGPLSSSVLLQRAVPGGRDRGGVDGDEPRRAKALENRCVRGRSRSRWAAVNHGRWSNRWTGGPADQLRHGGPIEDVLPSNHVRGPRSPGLERTFVGVHVRSRRPRSPRPGRTSLHPGRARVPDDPPGSDRSPPHTSLRVLFLSKAGSGSRGRHGTRAGETEVLSRGRSTGLSRPGYYIICFSTSVVVV